MVETLNEAIAYAKRWKPFEKPPLIDDLLSGKAKPVSIDEQIVRAEKLKILREALEVAAKMAEDLDVPESLARRQFRKIIVEWAGDYDDKLLEWCLFSLKIGKAYKLMILRFKNGDEEKAGKVGEIADALIDELDRIEETYRPPEAVANCWRYGLD